jgi:hypothetical protein
MRSCYGDWRRDPGPCPVDDTPHTACTPESVSRQITVAVQRPRVLDQAPQPVATAAPEFSTKTYRRNPHRKLLRGAARK